MKKLSLAILVSASLITVNASARSGYVGQVPNGSFNNCVTCHTGQNGGPSWNAFGEGIRSDAKYLNGGPVWAEICPEDFDGDGASNGAELGDPDCKFPDEAAGTYVSDPADDSSVPPVNNGNNGTNNGTTAGNNGTTAGNNGTTAGNNGTTAAGNNGTTAGGNNGNTSGNNGNTGGNNNTGGNTNTGTTSGGDLDDDGCSSTGSNPGQFSLIALLGLVFLGRKRRKN